MVNVNGDFGRAESLADQFSRIMSRSISERLVHELTIAEVTYPQLQALHFIAHHEQVTVGDISEGLGISYPSATNMIQRLSKKGLVEKCEDPRDRRAVQVGLSQHGTEIVQQLEDERIARFHSVLARLKVTQRNRLAEALADFVESALELGIARPDEICLHCGSERQEKCLIRARRGDDFCK